jgi:hypothetical protein
MKTRLKHLQRRPGLFDGFFGKTRLYLTSFGSP